MMNEGCAPYVGRRSFDVPDHNLFFGRDRECRELRMLWAEHPLVILHGSAGCGKTSLLRAGLSPLLAQDADVLPVAKVTVGSAFPEAALPDHNPHTLAVLSSWSPYEPLTRLAGLALADFLIERVLIKPALRRHPIYVAIDQVETMFRNVPEERHLEDFFLGLAAALGTVRQLRALLSVRSESLIALLSHTQDLVYRSPVYELESCVSRASALDAIKRPVEFCGLSEMPGLAEAVVDELAGPHQESTRVDGDPALPQGIPPTLLQVVCARLYHDQAQTNQGINLNLGALATYCNRVLTDFCLEVVAEISVELQISVTSLADWIASAFITASGGRKVVWEESGVADGMPTTVVQALANRHVLHAARSSGRLCYKLASDRLIPAVRDLASRSQAHNAPNTDAASHLRATEMILAEGALALAEKHAGRALAAADPEDLNLQAEILSVLGNIAFKRGLFDTAKHQYWLAAEIHERLRDEPAVGRLLGAIGRMHARQGHYVAALEDLQSAVARSPEDMTLRTELAKVLWHEGQAQAAAAVLGTVLTVEPGSAEALAGRAQIRAESGSASSALDDLQILLQIRPSMGNRPDVRSAYALALARAGREETAMEEADAAVASAVNSGPVFFRAARVAHVGGADGRAATLLRKAVEASDPELSPDQMRQAQRLLRSIG